MSKGWSSERTGVRDGKRREARRDITRLESATASAFQLLATTASGLVYIEPADRGAARTMFNFDFPINPRCPVQSAITLARRPTRAPHVILSPQSALGFT